jgi:hypothetical protein
MGVFSHRLINQLAAHQRDGRQKSDCFVHHSSNDFYIGDYPIAAATCAANFVCAVKSYKLDRFEMKMFDKDTVLLTYWEEQDTVCNKPVPSPCSVSSLYIKRGEKWLNVFYQQTQIQK